MIIGERRSKTLASGYGQHPLHAYAEAFKQTTDNIVTESGINLYTEIGRTVQNGSTNEALKRFFIEGSYDPEGMTAAEIEDHEITMEAQYENDREGILTESVSGGDINPIVGMTFPLHKYILMNMVFDKGAIPKVVAQSPKFTLSLETRILVDTEGNEIDMFKQQNQMTAAIDRTAPVTEFEVTSLPLLDTTEIVAAKLSGTAGVDHLAIETSVCAVKITGVYFEVGDILPDETTGYIELRGGKPATEAATKDVWVRINAPFSPVYGEYERAVTCPFTYEHKWLDSSTVKVKTVKDIITGTMHNDRLNVAALHGAIKGIRIRTKLDTSNARQSACSVKWKERTDIVEIGNAVPINTTISPEEVKDIAALYNVNQLTKIMSLLKTALGNYKDDKIKDHLDESFKVMDDGSRILGQFDYAPREGYALDHVEWRHKTFFDYFDTQITTLMQALNDPNMVVTVFGNPDLVRKITPTSYDYQTPSNIGPVELDFTKTVVTSDRRVYQFIGSDKLRNSTELIVVLCPRGTDRITYRIYDYQMYISNEIRNANNPALPAIHAFERWKMVDYQPVQGRINILNPSGIRQEGYDYVKVKYVDPPVKVTTAGA